MVSECCISLSHSALNLLDLQHIAQWLLNTTITFYVANMHFLQRKFPFHTMFSIIPNTVPGRIQTGVSLPLSKQTVQHSCSNSYLLAQHYRVKSIESDVSRLYLPASKQAGYHKKSYHWFYQLFLSKQVSWLKSLLFQKVSAVLVVFFHTWGLCPNGCFMDDSSGIWSRDWSLYWPVW